ncbi:S8 family serine peptidase [Puniceicoccaceae bacterium K14]|nr:S8 family serine peptidase [Puniceicoccaceae bacterium K14]
MSRQERVKTSPLTKWHEPQFISSLIEDGDGKGVKVAIIDSGIEIDHPVFSGKRLKDDLQITTERIGNAKARKRIISPNNGLDIFGHGTAVASLVWDTAPMAEIGSFRVFGTERSSKSEMIYEAAMEAIRKGYQIINCSFGCEQPSLLPIFKKWVDFAYLNGVHIIAAGNNSNIGKQVWPAYFSSVTASDTAPALSRLNFGYNRKRMVEFYANGTNLRLPWINGGFKATSGTSYAAPRLSGILARILSTAPNLHPLEAKSILIHLAQKR